MAGFFEHNRVEEHLKPSVPLGWEVTVAMCHSPSVTYDRSLMGALGFAPGSTGSRLKFSVNKPSESCTPGRNAANQG